MDDQRKLWTGLLWACATWLVHAFALHLVAMAFVKCVPDFVETYDGLGMELPAMTLMIIKLSNLVVNFWYLLVILLFFDFVFLIGASLSGPVLRSIARAWSTLLLFGTILLLGVTIIATAVPFQVYLKREAREPEAIDEEIRQPRDLDNAPGHESDSTTTTPDGNDVTTATPNTFDYPQARLGDQVDDYHGTQVADPYRWLEDPDSPETRAWIEAENKITFAFLEKIPQRERLRQRLGTGVR